MAQDDWIGDPNKHDTWSSSPSPNEPIHGFVERRLSKLEFYQRDINGALEVLQQKDRDGFIVCPCKACQAPLPSGAANVQFPICEDCLTSMGQITQAKRDLNFIE